MIQLRIPPLAGARASGSIALVVLPAGLDLGILGAIVAVGMLFRG